MFKTKSTQRRFACGRATVYISSCPFEPPPLFVALLAVVVVPPLPVGAPAVPPLGAATLLDVGVVILVVEDLAVLLVQGIRRSFCDLFRTKIDLSVDNKLNDLQTKVVIGSDQVRARGQGDPLDLT